MKRRNFLKSLGALALAGLTVAAVSLATAATYTRQNARVTRFQCDPVYNGAGTVTGVPIQSWVVQRLVNDTDATDVRGTAEMVQVNFDLLDPTITNLPINGVSGRTFGQLAADMRQAVLTRANAQGVQ
jgi:hypothetical protein